MVITQDDVLEFVQKNGPLLSIKVAKHFKINTTYAGAYLSELVSKKKIRFSHLKIGTSPLYYIDSQKEKLQEYSEKLNLGEKRAFDILKQKKILRDKKLDAITRNSLRNLKDFAVSIIVNYKNQKEIFWKFFTLNNDEAQKLIKEIITPSKPEPKKIKPKIQETKEKEEIQTPEKIIKQDIDKQKQGFLEKQKQIKKKEEELLKEKKELEKDLHLKIEQEHKELEKQRKEFLKEQQEMKKQRQELMGMMEEIRQERSQLERIRSGKEPIKAAIQKKIVPIQERVEKEKDPFFTKIREYMKSNQMKIKDYEIIKKGQVDLTISIPAAIGEVDYYCCAKKKKRSNEGDLSTAYIKGQNKKLPTLYLSLGNITKKAQEMLTKEFKGLVVKKIE